MLFFKNLITSKYFFPYTALPDWFYNGEKEFSARYELKFYLQSRLIFIFEKANMNHVSIFTAFHLKFLLS